MTIKEIAELEYRRLYPTSGDKPPVTLVEFVRTATYEYAYQALLFAWNEKNREGHFFVPSHFIDNKTLEVKDNKINIEGIGALTSLPSEVWLQSIGNIGTDCTFVKFTFNSWQTLGNKDSSLDDTDVPYYAMKKEVIFPKGVKEKKLTVYYASGMAGDDVEIDGALGAIVMRKLAEIYGNRIPKDVTLNDNPNN